MAAKTVQFRPRGSNTTQSGVAQGTPGGVTAFSRGKKSFSSMGNMQDVKYIWVLVAAEALAVLGLRKKFRRYHGG